MTGPWAMFADAGWLAALLLVSQFLRAKVPAIQMLYLPSAVTAGIAALVLGPQVLDVIPFSDNLPSYAWLLVVVLFATFPFATPPVKNVRDVLRRAGNTFFFNMGAEVGLFAAALVAGGLLLPVLFPELEQSFPLLLPAGFVGGHAYAASIGGTLERYADFEAAVAIGYTFATIGIVSSIAIGVPLIRWGIRRGHASSITSLDDAPESLRTGILASDEQASMGRVTVSSGAMDALGFHVAIVLSAALGGYYLTRVIQDVTETHVGFSVYLPEVATAMVVGLALRALLNRTRLGQDTIDQEVIGRIGGTVTDWLVGFGIAAIKLSVVAEYLPAVLVMVAIGFLTTLTYIFVVSRRFYEAHWFERGVFVFGWCTGVVAMGITLLRIVDPEHRSKTLEAYGLAYVLIAPLELVMIASVPVFVGKGFYWETTAVLVACFVVLMILGLRFSPSKTRAQIKEATA